MKKIIKEEPPAKTNQPVANKPTTNQPTAATSAATRVIPPTPVANKLKEDAKKKEAPVKAYQDTEPSELVIKEIMVQKQVTREKAIEILKNPK